MIEKNLNTDIAIIGMAGRFPGADNVDQFWLNIINRIHSISQFTDVELLEAGIAPEILLNSNYVKAKGYLKNADYFDAGFFKFSKHEAEILDPQYRLFFEVVWEALENAAYVPDDYQGKIGIFAGSSNIDTYCSTNLFNAQSTLLTDNFTIALHNAKDFLATLIAYKLNLRGPAITIQTACSTSLVALCLACQSLLSFETDIVIAGGTCVTNPLKSGYLFQDGMMLSPSGKCSTFDASADGAVLGNGLGAVVLKRLDEAQKDGDHIHAVIKGYAVNNDGSKRIGFTAPGVAGQQAVIESALKKANIRPDMISYIEAHGTGTILGDLIEVEALKQVFKGVSQSIYLGAVKPNIGHLDAASGIAGLIKTVQALKHRILPPNVNFQCASTHIALADTPFHVNTASADWENIHSARYAGVSSFGMGGTNAHVVLTEAPDDSRASNTVPQEPVLLILSARSTVALNQMQQNLLAFLEGHSGVDLTDLAYTLQVGRKCFKHRLAYACRTIEDAINQLKGVSIDVVSSQELTDLSAQWLAGQSNIDWSILHSAGRKRIPLPAYPFERERYWISRDNLNLPRFKAVSDEGFSKNKRPLINVAEVEKTIEDIFKRFLVKKNIDNAMNFYSLGGDSLSALLITHEINKALNLKLPFSIFDNNLSIKDLCAYIVNNIENQL